ncbi:MAG: FadR family transcriptional regulator [Chloroflexi bacterium]|nr:FadR family transcriptional regulator [Chloroflexota bacterium]
MDRQRGLFALLELRRQNLDEQIADVIQEMITTQQIRVGDRLPPERELSRLLNVNRSTIREAISLLQERGLVQMKAGSGTYVIHIPADTVGQAIKRYFVSRNCSQRDFMAVRLVLEPEIAALAASKATPEELANLADALGRMEASWPSKDDETYSSADVDFHFTLAVASHNDLFVGIASGTSALMRIWIGTTFRLAKHEDSFRLHREIHQAVVARDAQRAREAMRTHLETIPLLDS